MNRIYSLLLTMSVILLNCGTDLDPINSSQDEFIGNWTGTFFISELPAYDEDININVLINDDADSTYALNATYSVSGDTALRHIGTWSVSDSVDTIFLSGNNCAVYDTTLKQTIEKDCGPVTPIKINISGNTWSVPLSYIAPLAPSMGVDISSIPTVVLNSIIIDLVKN